jgi:hypothetical protein
MWYRRNISAGKEQIEDRAFSFVLERVEVGRSSPEAVVLHELVSGSFDEECAHKLELIFIQLINIMLQI